MQTEELIMEAQDIIYNGHTIDYYMYLMATIVCCIIFAILLFILVYNAYSLYKDRRPKKHNNRILHKYSKLAYIEQKLERYKEYNQHYINSSEYKRLKRMHDELCNELSIYRDKEPSLSWWNRHRRK